MSKKTQFCIVVLCTFLSITTLCPRTYTNKTFFKHSFVGQDFIMQHAMTSHFIHKQKIQLKENSKGELVDASLLSKLFEGKPKEKRHRLKLDGHGYDNFFISSTVFWEESSSSNGLAKYFFPNGKTELTVEGHAVGGTPDIYAEWLGIPSSGDLSELGDYTFSSKIKISPYLQRVGANIHVHKVLHDNFWVSLFAPFVEVSTNMHLSEFNISGNRSEGLMPAPEYFVEVGGGGYLQTTVASLYFEEPLNVTQALVHPLMKYGKIDNKVHRLAGFADITLRLGYTKKFNDVTTFDVYTGLIIPTGYKPTAEYVFEPIVGNGQHFGVNFGFNLVSKLTGNISFISCVDYQYLFEGKERRSFDLKQNGPWSRYMAATVGLPRSRAQRLINYLTDDVNITPGSLVNFLLALHLNYKKFNVEIGSDIECRAAESIHLKKGFNKYVGIAFYDDGDPTNMLIDNLETYNRTYSRAKIDSTMLIPSVNGDASFTSITFDQIDLDSARHPNMVSAKFYVSLGGQGTINDKPFLFDIGGTYGFGSNNKALDYWNLWLKLNLSI